MTRDEAERAAATFEFPPFRCRAFPYLTLDENREWMTAWGLQVRDCLDRTNGIGYFLTVDAWLEYYTEHQRIMRAR